MADRKQYRLKAGAPDHYVNGQGIIKAGGTFWYAGPALSKWCEEVPVAKPEPEPAKSGKGKDAPQKDGGGEF